MPGPHWVSPRAVYVGGSVVSQVTPCSFSSRVVRSKEPCALGGHLAGSIPHFLHPSPPISNHFPAFISSTKQKQNKRKSNSSGPPPPRLPSLPSLRPCPQLLCSPSLNPLRCSLPSAPLLLLYLRASSPLTRHRLQSPFPRAFHLRLPAHLTFPFTSPQRNKRKQEK